MEYRVELGIKNKEKWEKIPFWALSRDMYRYTLNVYRYTIPEPNMYQYMHVGGVLIQLVLFSQFRPVFVFWP